jgi:DNA-binding PadR family transcriptional regulator
VRLGTGTLYGIMKRLLADGLIGGASPIGRGRRRPPPARIHLTPFGREVAGRGRAPETTRHRRARPASSRVAPETRISRDADSTDQLIKWMAVATAVRSVRSATRKIGVSLDRHQQQRLIVLRLSLPANVFRSSTID